MKLIKASNGQKTVKISKSEWESLGKTYGWIRESMEASDGLSQQDIYEDTLIGLKDKIRNGFETYTSSDWAQGEIERTIMAAVYDEANETVDQAGAQSMFEEMFNWAADMKTHYESLSTWSFNMSSKINT
jgi:hypothetical protein